MHRPFFACVPSITVDPLDQVVLKNSLYNLAWKKIVRIEKICVVIFLVLRVLCIFFAVIDNLTLGEGLANIFLAMGRFECFIST